MAARNLDLGRVFGITIRVNISWAFIALLIAWSLAEGFFPTVYEGLPQQMYWWMAVAGVIGLAFSIVAHELSHSLVGRAFGIEVKTITLFLFGGAAQMEDEPPDPRAEMFMAAAGPAMSLALAGAFNIIAFWTSAFSEPLAVVLGYLAILNLVLAIFNMIPAFPMDGGRVLRGAIWAATGDLRKATGMASRAGAAFGWILSGLGVVLIIGGAFVGGLWWILIGQFIRMAALSSWRQLEARRVLGGKPVRDFMTRDPVSAPADITLERFLEDWLYRTHHEAYPVVRDGRPVGLVGVSELKQTPREDWSSRSVADAMTPADEASLPADIEAMDAIRRMQESGRTRLMVVENGELVGMITLKDLMEHLAMRLDLGQG
ncbi:site-2 protease family protein [Marinicauda salina]|uniref:Zinc metalloprotease n=1 Tax=Marinicauda salina TaxID=2135793 RepID=A0A2U2BVM1_9PROT|nr:site-2 protease family protein [Marinicauda salina]PWE18052.1 site-2 protease family protein [Marinicauda salina]